MTPTQKPEEPLFNCACVALGVVSLWDVRGSADYDNTKQERHDAEGPIWFDPSEHTVNAPGLFRGTRLCRVPRKDNGKGQDERIRKRIYEIRADLSIKLEHYTFSAFRPFSFLRTRDIEPSVRQGTLDNGCPAPIGGKRERPTPYGWSLFGCAGRWRTIQARQLHASLLLPVALRDRHFSGSSGNRVGAWKDVGAQGSPLLCKEGRGEVDSCRLTRTTALPRGPASGCFYPSSPPLCIDRSQG